MKKKFIITSILITGSLLFFWGIQTVQATVETGWPAGKANICKNPTDGFIDFEKGVEEAVIKSTIPGMEFTTTYGINWRYGDIRTGKYNVYPYGHQGYETNGNFFAWLGVTGDVGRIDFTGGAASYLSVLVSTYSGVKLDAYDANGNFLATSGWATNNINTRTFTRLTVEAPGMVYILVHDTGNYWLIDDLCTDAPGVCKIVPGRTEGNHQEKIDLLFVPDDDYGSASDIDTWLPTFLSQVNHKIDDRLGGKTPVSGNLNKFNFYYTTKQGSVNDSNCGEKSSLPDNILTDCPFVDAVVVVHKTEFGDCSTVNLSPDIYSAEGPTDRSFIHESGHGIFGLADEYDGAPDCRTYYFQPSPNPNIWATEAACRTDATNEGWNPNDCQRFTTCQDDWWKLGTTEYIMWDGARFSNGWGNPASRRISWYLSQFKDPPEIGKSIFLDLNISNETITLFEKTFITDSPPNYLPGEYAYTAKMYSLGGSLLGEYGFGDPRIKLAEWDYTGPTWLDSADFSLILPYFCNIGRADIIDSTSGKVLISIGLSELATECGMESPVANANGPYEGNEGSLITLDASGSYDPNGQIVLYEWDLDCDGQFDDATGVNPNYTWGDDYSGCIGLKVTDNDGLTDTDSTTVTVSNVAPTVGAITAPVEPVQANTNINTSADFTDPGWLDTHTAIWDFGDGATQVGTLTEENNPPDATGQVTSSHAYTAAGIYTIQLTVTDDDGETGLAVFRYVVVYNSEGGFVTGGGWIESPVGAYTPEPLLTGKATFGFVSKYQKGATTPTGQTQFIFHMAHLNFHSTSYQWLVVAGAKAQFKGSGTINGQGDYGFILTATDGQITGGGGVDKFRIKIWDKATEMIVYDNQMSDAEDAAPTQAIKEGSIVIHK